MKKKVSILIVILGAIFLCVGSFIFNVGNDKKVEKKDDNDVVLKDNMKCSGERLLDGVKIYYNIEMHSKNGILINENMNLKIEDKDFFENAYDELKEDYKVEKNNNTLSYLKEYKYDEVLLKDMYDIYTTNGLTCK